MAPKCPHDCGCPIHWSEVGKGKLVCGFSQRMERPSFVRRTKHSGVGHEDIGYSYVVIRRGPRPSVPDIKVGRLGEVGQRQIRNEGAKRQPVELELDNGGSLATTQLAQAIVPPEEITEPPTHSPAEIDSLLKAESFHWPRLVFPPLKKSGHVVMDVCAPSGMSAFFTRNSYQTQAYRRHHAYDHPKVTRETTILRRPQIRLG